MKIDKVDEEKLREIFNTLKYSNLNMKGNIKRSQVKGFRIPAYMQNETKTGQCKTTLQTRNELTKY
jgi:hypothetical protein